MKPTNVKRPAGHYARLEQHRQRILCPSTWGAMLGDETALGSHAVEGRL
jgi:hypothetical protein